MTQTSTSNILFLDEHHKPFFSKTWHAGRVEARFSLDVPGLRDQVFVARLAQLLTGEWVVILQEQQVDATGAMAGEVRHFILQVSSVDVCPAKNPNSKKEVKKFWKRLLKIADGSHPQGGYKLFRNSLCDNLSRLHFHHRLKAGCRVGFDGQCDFFDSREVTNHQGIDFFRFRVASTLPPLFNAHELLGMSDAMFHDNMKALFRDPQERLAASIRFHRADENQLIKEFIGQHLLICQEAEKVLSLLLGTLMNAGSELEDWRLARWKMWTNEPLTGIGIDGQPRSKDIWDELKDLRADVLNKFGCHLPLYYTVVSTQTLSFAHIYAANFMRQFQCERDSSVPAHDFAVKLSDLS